MANKKRKKRSTDRSLNKKRCFAMSQKTPTFSGQTTFKNAKFLEFGRKNAKLATLLQFYKLSGVFILRFHGWLISLFF